MYIYIYIYIYLYPDKPNPGADVNRLMVDLLTPLHQAAMKGHKNVAELLKIKFVAANEMRVAKSEEEKALILEIELINCELRTCIHTHSYI